MDRLEATLFEKSSPGRRGCHPPSGGVALVDPVAVLGAELVRETPPALPELGELQVLRHFMRLSQLNFSIDTNFYPLGSCTMKYNPRVNEVTARMPGFARLHPMQPMEAAQGALELMHNLQNDLQEITGMDGFTLQPAAGAHGELTALFMAAAYFRDRGEKRTRVVVPDSSHGTNPASAALAGFEVITIPTNAAGDVDLEQLKQHLNNEVACLMLTNPSTLGLFEQHIVEVARLVHEAGGLLYYDGANMNALLGVARPGDMGFDLVHLNLHKTMSTPHGGGGPGAGPVGARGALVDYLPGPRSARQGEGFTFETPSKSIGRVRMFWGNFLVLVRAYTYIRHHGPEGLREVAEGAVMAANYLRARVKDAFDMPYDRLCMHEFVLSARTMKEKKGVRAMDVAKRLLDYGFHAPTVYFPLCVEEALMIEPTETETLETLDSFAEALLKIAQEDVALVTTAPHTTPVGRADEARAARKPILRWEGEAP
ncbi:glycine dehydrogenase subunit 2 [bacterium CPR1]|nr:glycine dehydrogenase subunit 2 [bacterium CPR1]